MKLSAGLKNLKCILSIIDSQRLNCDQQRIGN